MVFPSLFSAPLPTSSQRPLDIEQDKLSRDDKTACHSARQTPFFRRYSAGRFGRELCRTVLLPGIACDESGFHNLSAGKFACRRGSKLAAARQNRHSVTSPRAFSGRRSNLRADRQLCTKQISKPSSVPHYPNSSSTGISNFQNRNTAAGKVCSAPTGTDSQN